MGIQLGKRRAFTAVFTLDDNVTPASVDETQQEVSATGVNGTIEEFAKTLDANGKVIGCSGKFRPAALGPVQVQVTGDADRGDGVRTITLVGDETCIEGEATGGTVTFGGADEV